MGLKKWRRDKSLEGSAQNSRRTSIGRFRTRSRTSPFSSSFETVMTTSGHHVVRGNEWKVPSPEMMTYMSYTYPHIHSHTMCIQCTVRMNTNTHTVTHPHTHTHTCMHNIYNCTHDTPPVGALHRRHICLMDEGPG